MFSPSFFSDPAGYLGDRAKSFAAGLRDAPFSTLGNVALGVLSPAYSVANLAHGVINSQNPNANLLGDIMSLGGGKSAPTTQTAGLLDTPAPGAPSGSKDSPFADDTRGGSGGGHSLASGTGGPLSQQTPTDVARGALARALVATPDSLNRWDGNKFVPGSNAGAPAGYNSWNGNQFRTPGGMTYGPGLVSSFDPNGRQYVTRWGYTG
jgi:hypothetical protein